MTSHSGLKRSLCLSVCLSGHPPTHALFCLLTRLAACCTQTLPHSDSCFTKRARRGVLRENPPLTKPGPCDNHPCSQRSFLTGSVTPSLSRSSHGDPKEDTVFNQEGGLPLCSLLRRCVLGLPHGAVAAATLPPRPLRSPKARVPREKVGVCDTSMTQLRSPKVSLLPTLLVEVVTAAELQTLR